MLYVVYILNETSIILLISSKDATSSFSLYYEKGNTDNHDEYMTPNINLLKDPLNEHSHKTLIEFFWVAYEKMMNMSKSLKKNTQIWFVMT